MQSRARCPTALQLTHFTSTRSIRARSSLQPRETCPISLIFPSRVSLLSLSIDRPFREPRPGPGLFLLTTTVRAFRDLTIVRKPGIFQTDQVLLNGRGPTFAQSRTLRLVAEIETNHVLAVQLSLEVDQAHAVANGFSLPRQTLRVSIGLTIVEPNAEMLGLLSPSRRGRS